MEEKIYRLNKWGNKITKRFEDGSPVYTIHNNNDEPICVVSFAGKRGDVVTNGDLLEIVHDRLHSFNTTRFATHNTHAAEDRVVEAILWSEKASMRRAAHVEDKANTGAESEA